MNIKLEQYKIFLEAATTLSFSQAARNLFITQSAVSQTITTLEKELDTKLFVRKSKGVELTKEGSMLESKISHALSLITSAENELSNNKELKSGELVIGAGDTLCENFLIPHMIHFRELYPHVKIRVINRTSLETIELLKSGQLDIGFINMPINDESLTVTPCYFVHDIFVSCDQDEHVYTYEELSHKNLILLEKSSNTRHYIDHCFSEQGVLLKPDMELGAHELLLEFAKNRLGISCVIKEFSQDMLSSGEIHEIKINPPLKKRSIGYAYASRRSLSVASLKFIELIENN